MNDKKTFTVGDFIDAMERNGYPQARDGNWIVMTKDETKVRRACAMGQGLLNMGLDQMDFQHVFREVTYREGYYIRQNFTSFVMYLNDTEKLSIKKIAERAREKFKSVLNEKVTVKTHQWIKEK